MKMIGNHEATKASKKTYRLFTKAEVLKGEIYSWSGVSVPAQTGAITEPLWVLARLTLRALQMEQLMDDHEMVLSMKLERVWDPTRTTTSKQRLTSYYR